MALLSMRCQPIRNWQLKHCDIKGCWFATAVAHFDRQLCCELFWNHAFNCVNAVMAINLELNEHSFGKITAWRPAQRLHDCGRRCLGTPPFVYGPLMKQESQPIVP